MQDAKREEVEIFTEENIGEAMSEELYVSCTGNGSEDNRECRECGGLVDGNCDHCENLQKKWDENKLLVKPTEELKCEDCIVGTYDWDIPDEDKVLCVESDSTDMIGNKFKYCPMCGRKI